MCAVAKSVKVEERKQRFLEGMEKDFGEVESKEVEGNDVYIPERDFVRLCHLSCFHWSLGSDLSPFGKYFF